MHSDDWHRQGCVIENRIKVSGPVYYRHAYDKNGVLVGVIVDFEYADDYHYELLAKDWDAFCDRCLNGEDSIQAFKAFFGYKDLESISGKFAFESALNMHQIKFQKIAFY